MLLQHQVISTTVLLILTSKIMKITAKITTSHTHTIKNISLMSIKTQTVIKTQMAITPTTKLLEIMKKH